MTFVSDRAAEAIVKGEPRKPECMMEKEGSTENPDTRTDILIYERKMLCEVCERIYKQT